ncbi:MAG: DNA pilot protein [Microvirus sp.]|nr:MAG: DNA pilot protein [Microvirus sp.]
MDVGGIGTSFTPAPSAAPDAGGSLFPGIGSIVGGALGGIGSVISGLFAQSSAKRQMDFQERMSSTAHQREVTDLRAAGLNPILSASHGGASSPGGASAQMPNPGQDLGAGVSASARMMGIEMPQLESSIRLQAAQGESQYASAESNRADAVLKLTQANAIGTDVSLKQATRDRILQLTQPEVGESLARSALMRQQKEVEQASALQIQQDTQRSAAQTANERARLGRIEYESSSTGIGIDAATKVIGAAGDLIPLGKGIKALGGIVGGGPASGQRVKGAINSLRGN